MARSKILKSFEDELEVCGFPRDPASIVGRKFRLVIKEAVWDEFRKKYTPYVLFGTVLGLDRFTESEMVYLLITPNETALGKILNVWLTQQFVGVQQVSCEGQHYKQESIKNELFGQFTLL